MLKAVIFDVDGTLAETKKRIARHSTRCLGKLVWDGFGPEQYRELLKVTGGKERIRHYAQTELMTDMTDEKLLRYID